MRAGGAELVRCRYKHRSANYCQLDGSPTADRWLQNDYIVVGGVNVAPWRHCTSFCSVASASATAAVNESHRSHDAHPTVLCMT